MNEKQAWFYLYELWDKVGKEIDTFHAHIGDVKVHGLFTCIEEMVRLGMIEPACGTAMEDKLPLFNGPFLSEVPYQKQEEVMMEFDRQALKCKIQFCYDQYKAL